MQRKAAIDSNNRLGAAFSTVYLDSKLASPCSRLMDSLLFLSHIARVIPDEREKERQSRSDLQKQSA